MKRRLSPIQIVLILSLPLVVFSVVYGLLRDTSTNKAWKACEQALEVGADSFSGDVFVVSKLNDDTPTQDYWEVMPSFPYGENIQLGKKLSASGAVLCVRVVDDKKKPCIYLGESILMIGSTLEAKLIRWPDGALIAQTTTESKPPTKCPETLWCEGECKDQRYYTELPKNWISGFVK